MEMVDTIFDDLHEATGSSFCKLLVVWTMSTRFKAAQCSSVVAILICIIALSYDDLTGYHENNIHLICGWNTICIKPTDNNKRDCILYDDCESLNIMMKCHIIAIHKSTGSFI